MAKPLPVFTFVFAAYWAAVTNRESKSLPSLPLPLLLSPPDPDLSQGETSEIDAAPNQDTPSQPETPMVSEPGADD
jgi:hypothetical protein